MDVTITKGETDDGILIRRADGSVAETRFPKKGPLPHDAIHYIVEDRLGLSHAFWGLVAGGRHPDDIQALAKSAGHASARRAAVPQPEIVALLQAERLVECFEATIWGGVTSPETFRAIAREACESAHVPMPALDDSTITSIQQGIDALSDEWATGSFRFSWPDP